MTATTVELVTGSVSRELRREVRDHVEQEYLRLRDVERPALLARFDALEKGAEVTTLGRSIVITDYRIAAIADHLGVEHDPHPDDGICPRCCVLLDRGDGPQWLLLAALTEDGLPIIASDSALGRALIGTRPGQTVRYPSPSGVETARVLALEPVFSAV